ncbi:MAG: hypothetical protein K2K64_04710, partial [Muribaculaceae bacterium]|nr:hypothetical protein [Muribaculaceae bacterium]
NVNLISMCLVGSLMFIIVEDTSISLNMQYEREINDLTEAIAECRDSAAFYRRQREMLIHHSADLEHIAREKFHMQRPSEDVFIIKEK